MSTTLTTLQGEKLAGTPWDVYPRPQLRRNNYVNLNGQWDFCVSESQQLPTQYDRQIMVPFCPESQLSGIGQHFAEGSYLFYRRQISRPEGQRVLLHIGAADQELTCYVNQKEIGSHIGGYEAITFDITDALQETNELVLRCKDDLRSHVYPYGKQVMKRGGMWYTPVSGIWQTVWLETVPQNYVNSIDIQVTLDTATVTITPALEGIILCEGKTYPVTAGKAIITPEEPKLWTPETPHLYDFTVEAGEDCFESYFALRTLEIKEVGGYMRLCLNGKPYFFHGLLDQGYWPDGLFLPGSPEGYTWDIQTMKELGFNTLRKHIKIEPERFYYDCDRLGMLVFQDLVNSGPYHYLRDTAIPTIGGKLMTYHQEPSERRRNFFLIHGELTLRHLHNHPCIVLYTLFNEGWGQHDTQNLYRHFKAMAPNRIWNAASGWFKSSDSDVQSEHVYFGSLKLKPNGRRPLLLTEFGGYSCALAGHRFNPDEEYGYRKYAAVEEFQAALSRLYREDILPQIKDGLCGTILTQVSDVEDETNGLVTYDRKVIKADREEMQNIARELMGEI